MIRRILGVLLGACVALSSFSLPARAAPSADLSVSITSPELNLTSGGEGGQLSVTLRNNGPDAVKPYLILTIPFSLDGVKAERASTSCRLLGADVRCSLDVLAAGSSRAVTVDISGAPAGAVDSTKTENVVAVVTPDSSEEVGDANSQNNTAEQTATLAPEPQPVSEISGSVRDTSGNPVANAEVMLRDADGHEETLHTDEAGFFLYTPGDVATDALQRGEIVLSVTAAGYEGGAERTVTAGDEPVVDIALILTAAAESDPVPLSAHSAETLADEKRKESDEKKLTAVEVLLYGTAVILALMALFALIMYTRHRAELRRSRRAAGRQ